MMAERLGQRGAEIALNVYTHIDRGMQNKGTERHSRRRSLADAACSHHGCARRRRVGADVGT